MEDVVVDLPVTASVIGIMTPGPFHLLKAEVGFNIEIVVEEDAYLDEDVEGDDMIPVPIMVATSEEGMMIEAVSAAIWTAIVNP